MAASARESGIITLSTWQPRAGELARFGLSSAAMLAFKLLLMQPAEAILNPLPAYAMVQVVVFMASYAMHSRVTFGTPFSWPSLARYGRTILVFQLIDWLVFAVVFTRFRIESELVILICSAVVFVLRFIFVRRSLGGGRRGRR